MSPGGFRSDSGTALAFDVADARIADPGGAGLGENMYMKVEVECYAGRKADERPVRFRLDEHEYRVEEVLDQGYGPGDLFFKVRADDGNVYILRHETSVIDGEWELVSFRGTDRV